MSYRDALAPTSRTPLTYLDSSLALEAVLESPLRTAAVDWLLDRSLVSSRLLKTEVLRALRRDSKPIDSANWLFARIGFFILTNTIHLRAEAIAPHVKSLDALHLGTALGIEVPLEIAARDKNLCVVASGLGLTLASLPEEP